MPLKFNGDTITFGDNSVLTSAGIVDSSRYVICKTGDSISGKYAAAKLLTPGGAALSATNRAHLIVMPGVYTLSAQWEIDAEFVDIIGIGSSSLHHGCSVAVTVTTYDINVSANNVRIKGIGTSNDRAFKIESNKPLQVFEQCIGGSASFGSGSGVVASGKFTNCTGGDSSFGGGDGGIASGTFSNCLTSGEYGGYNSFGGNSGTASGTFSNCKAEPNPAGFAYSFGGDSATSSGEFINCESGAVSFGGFGIASGTYTNCIAGDTSFGRFGTASGKFLYCRLTSGSFQAPATGGKQRFCIDGSFNQVNAG